MRLLAIILLTFFTSMVFSQIPVSTQIWSSPLNVGIVSGVNATSSDFNNSFTLGLFQNEQLSSEVVLQQQNKLRSDSLNQLGLDYETSVYGSIPLNSSGHSVLLKLSDAAHAHAAAPIDVFSGIFQGNKEFAGDTMDFSNAKGLAMRYQKIGIGWQYAPTISTSVYAIANFVNGEQLAELHMNRGTLYTSPFGDTLTGDFLATYYQSDTAQTGFASPNGGGLSFDVGLNTTFAGKNSNWDLSLNVVDLGMIQWQTRTVKTEVDTIVNWTGVNLPQIDQIDNGFTENLSDSLSSSVRHLSRKGKYRNWLAGSFHAQLLQSAEKGLEWGGGAVVRWKTAYDPFAYVLGGYQFNEYIDGHAIVGYGGFGAFQFGVQASAALEHFTARLSIQNLEGWFAPKSHLGASGQLAIQYLF